MNEMKLGKCLDCGRPLQEGYNNFIWCICGYKDRSNEDPKLNKRDYGLLKELL